MDYGEIPFNKFFEICAKLEKEAHSWQYVSYHCEDNLGNSIDENDIFGGKLRNSVIFIKNVGVFSARPMGLLSYMTLAFYREAFKVPVD